MSLRARLVPFLASLFATALVALASETPAFRAEPYVWRSVAIGGGGFVTGIVTHPRQKGLMYARTDVGGAYRWDNDARRWIPLNDWTSETDWNLMGIESIAIDPNDPQRLYLAAGTYDRFPAAMLRSNDQGRTFQRTDVPIGMGGNEQGRFAGERLAVDPNDGAIVFFGSRRDGLWRSADHGATWTRVEGFPKIDADAETEPMSKEARRWNQPVGIIAVAFDAASGSPGKPTPAVFVAVSTTGTNLFRSSDTGKTWTAVGGQPTGLRPNHLVVAPERVAFLSYGREPGPGQMTAGAVWKWDLRSGAWTDISPVKGDEVNQPFGYGCVAVDEQHPATLMVTTWGHWRPHDQIFRSTDGGTTWRGLWDDDSAVWDYTPAPYTATRNPHWMGTIVVNPFDSNQALFTTGYGIWASTNLEAADAGRPVRWTFLDDGLEETVPLALVSPPMGAHLISGLGDIDGFRHEDLDTSPVGGTFGGPRFSSTRDIAFAADRPTTLARIGNAGRGLLTHIAMSDDDGKTWVTLEHDAPGGGNGLGRIALGADAKTLVWALSNGSAYATDDRGKTWERSAGIDSEVSIVADAVAPTRFYAFDARAGRFLVSNDSARHFAATQTHLAPLGTDAHGEALGVVPGRGGEVWIGSGSAGLYRSADGGSTFTKIDPVSAVEAVGFGKAAPGRTTPAVFVRGTVAGRPAFYRSDDGGQTWVRINDDEHQYGSANRSMIVGDPRVFGRVYLTTGGRGIIYGEPRR